MPTCEMCGQSGPNATPCTSNGGEYPCTVGLVCAWCDRVLVPGPEPVSHGICPECAYRRLGDRDDRDDSHERRERADELRAP